MEWIQFIQAVPAMLEPLPFKLKGEVVTDDDRKTWLHALVLQCCYCAELDENSCLRNPDQLKQWLFSIASVDIGVLGKELKTYAIAIRHYASQWAVYDYSTFKEYCGGVSFGRFFSPVKDYLSSFLANPTADTLRVLLQWTCFLTRITLETGFVPTSVDYLATEDRLEGLVPDETWDELRSILFPIAQRYEAKDFSPVFSNGANSDVPRSLGLWGKIRYGWHVNANQRYFLHRAGWEVSSCPEEEALNCKLVFVPKGIDSKRAICEEPAFNMYLQQALKNNVYSWFKHDTLLRRYIDLEDQSSQRARAQHASFTQTHATLDLSEASDSVSWRLVEYVFSGSSLFEDLRLTRTEKVLLPDGKLRNLSKFAPMGSALCFPTECLIFLGICLLGCKRVGVYPSIGVYGDDLIVPHEAEDCIAQLLNHFGFLLNEKKSFWGYEPFKESCGGEYYDGIDVTPLYIPRKFSGSVDSRPELMSTYCDFANLLFRRGFRWMRRYLLSHLLLPSFPGVLFGPTGNGTLQSLQPTNFHLKERWNSEWQIFEVRHQYLTDVGDEVEDDDARYFFALTALRDTRRQSLLFPEDRIDVKLTLPRQGIRWKWSRKEILPF